MIKKNENIILRQIHGSFFLIDISDNYAGDKCALYEINGTGKFIWENIDDETTVDKLAQILKNAIIEDIDFDIIFNDVLDYVNELKSNGFVEVQNG